MDHDIQNTSASNLAKYQEIKQFAKEQGVDYYEPGNGIGHQVMIERGYAFPLSLCVASDSHANMYGGIGVLGTPLVRTDAAAIWATGTTWWQIPPCIGVRLEGALRPGVYGKDVILTLCGLFNKDQVLNAALVFYGPGVASLSISDRLAIANMTTEWGSLAGLFPVDDAVIAWLNKNPHISQERINTLEKSPDYSQGPYAKELMLDLSSVMPSITGPDSVKIVRPATELLGQAINKAYLLSCANARTEDLGEAAKVIRDLGGKVAEGVEFYVAAASRDVQQAAERNGDWQVLMEAGAIPLPAGCGPCIGLGSGVLKDGQVGISATNRNYKGRMGSVNAKTFLSSPAVVAASALAGHIALPFPVDKTTIIYAEKIFPNQSEFESNTEQGQEEEVVEGFPEMVHGRVILCAQDNINTDAIYAGKYTYREDMTNEMMKRVVMENYDPLFKDIVEKGDVLVGGFNFGTGSSREQAATALLAAGIQCVIAGSFSQTFFRNAINNGLLCLSSPALLKHLKAQKGNIDDKIRRAAEIDVWPHSGVIGYQGRTWSCDRIGRAAQQLIAMGGLTNWVKNEMNMLT